MSELTRATSITTASIQGSKDLGIRLLRISDLLSVLIAFGITFVIATIVPQYFQSFVSGSSSYLTLLMMLLVVFPLLSFEFELLHLYRYKFNPSVLVEWPRIFRGTAIASLLTLLMFSLVVGMESVRTFLLTWSVMLLTIPLGRYFVRAYFRKQHIRGRRLRPTIIFGAGKVGQHIAQKFLRRKDLGLLPIGFVDDRPPVQNETGLPYLGTRSQAQKIIEENSIVHAMIAFTAQPDREYLDTMKQLDDTGVFFTMIPRFFEVTMANFDTDDVEGIPVEHLGISRIQNINWTVKRCWDLVLSLTVLFFIWPLLILIAIVIFIESPGGVFFLQPRAGRYGKEFLMYKFRSMVADAEKRQQDLHAQNEVSGPLFKMKRDPRVTRVGRWLRLFSLDELPQILNVIKGDMSMVGPRPLWIEEAREVKGLELIRERAVPGITGLWQVSGRNELEYDEMIRLDYLYLRNYSFLLDLKIMLLTIPAVLSRRGAY